MQLESIRLFLKSYYIYLFYFVIYLIFKNIGTSEQFSPPKNKENIFFPPKFYNFL